jgi:hypothetical protein
MKPLINLAQRIRGGVRELFAAVRWLALAVLLLIGLYVVISTWKRQTSPAVPDKTAPASIDSINNQLAKLGNLSVSSVNPQGYPIFDFICDTGNTVDTKDKCVNRVGIPVGRRADVAKEMTTVHAADIKKFGYHCIYFCMDARGNIIGRPESPVAP